MLTDFITPVPAFGCGQEHRNLHSTELLSQCYSRQRGSKKIPDDPQQKSLTADADLSPNASIHANLSAVPQIDETLVASDMIGLLAFIRSSARRGLASRRQLDADTWRNVRDAALFRKGGAARGKQENGKTGQELHGNVSRDSHKLQ
jgi:hypothetical protein